MPCVAGLKKKGKQVLSMQPGVEGAEGEDSDSEMDQFNFEVPHDEGVHGAGSSAPVEGSQGTAGSTSSGESVGKEHRKAPRSLPMLHIGGSSFSSDRRRRVSGKSANKQVGMNDFTSVFAKCMEDANAIAKELAEAARADAAAAREAARAEAALAREHQLALVQQCRQQ